MPHSSIPNCGALTFWLRDDFGSLRKSSGSRLTFTFCTDDKAAAAAATADDDDDATATADSDDDDDDDEDEADDDVAAATDAVDPTTTADADDGCEPSNRPCISFGNRPDTSRGVVCPFNFVVVEGELL